MGCKKKGCDVGWCRDTERARHARMSWNEKNIERSMGLLKRKNEYRKKEKEKEKLINSLKSKNGKKKRGWKQKFRQFAKFLSIEPTDTRRGKSPMTSVRFRPVISPKKEEHTDRRGKRKDKCTKCFTRKPTYQTPTMRKPLIRPNISDRSPSFTSINRSWVFYERRGSAPISCVGVPYPPTPFFSRSA
jgi:hypothetical protein